jgi:hypothetical protein
MVNMSDELKERNILKLIFILRFACATVDVGHRIGITLAEAMTGAHTHRTDIVRTGTEKGINTVFKRIQNSRRWI